MLKLLGNLFTFWMQVSHQYARIAANPEKKDKSVRLGITSIILSVISATLVILSVFGLVTALDLISSSPIVGIFVLLLSIGAAITFLIHGMINALLYSIYQMRLNKKAIGWIALIVWFVCLATAIIGSWLILRDL